MPLPLITHEILRNRELPLALATKLTFMLRGGPGVGKTESIENFCRDRGIGYIDSRVLYFDPTDVKGFPSLDKKTNSFTWLPPAEFPLEGNDQVPEEGIWVFEELPLAAPSVQGALFQVINERRVGQRRVKPGWLILATGNRLSDKAGVNKMASPMVSRMRHLELTVSAEEWATYALDHGLMPELVAFFRWRPELLNSFDPTKWEHDTPYCCPRTAAYLSRTLQALPAGQQASPHLDLITGWVGEGVGVELYAFLDICGKLPSWDEVLAKPTTIPIPTQPSHLYAFSSLISRNTTVKCAKPVFQLLERPDFPQEHTIHVLLDVLKGPHNVGISNSPEFCSWAHKNVAMLSALGSLAPKN